MGGVDKGDQLSKYYHVRLKCQKNYKYMAIASGLAGPVLAGPVFAVVYETVHVQIMNNK